MMYLAPYLIGGICLFCLGFYSALAMQPKEMPADREILRQAVEASQRYFELKGLEAELRKKGPGGHPGDAVKIAHVADSHMAMLSLARLCGLDPEEIIDSRRCWYT